MTLPTLKPGILNPTNHVNKSNPKTRMPNPTNYADNIKRTLQPCILNPTSDLNKTTGVEAKSWNIITLGKA